MADQPAHSPELHARVFNAITRAAATRDRFLDLSDREHIAAAVLTELASLCGDTTLGIGGRPLACELPHRHPGRTHRQGTTTWTRMEAAPTSAPTFTLTLTKHGTLACEATPDEQVEVVLHDEIYLNLGLKRGALPFTPEEAEVIGQALAAAAHLARDLPERRNTDDH